MSSQYANSFARAPIAYKTYVSSKNYKYVFYLYKLFYY